MHVTAAERRFDGPNAYHARNGKRTLLGSRVSRGAHDFDRFSPHRAEFAPSDRPLDAFYVHPPGGRDAAGRAGLRPGPVRPAPARAAACGRRTTRSAVGEVLPVLIAAHDQDQ